MENSKGKREDSGEAIPSLIKAITAHEEDGFDSLKDQNDEIGSLRSASCHPLGKSLLGIEGSPVEDHSVSISMPSSPVNTKRVLFRDGETVLGGGDIPISTAGSHKGKAMSYSQSIPMRSVLNEAIAGGGKSAEHPRNPRIHKLRDKRYDSFKTWSGRLERQLTNKILGKRHEDEHGHPDQPHRQSLGMKSLPVDRYFDALEGPELETLRSSEEILLPDDKQWPFLLRYPISSFGICLGVSSQAIMWKTLASVESTKFLNISPHINLVLWFISIALVVIVAIIYSLKVILYFEAVRREYYHPIRINFFFAPWIALLFLALGVPPSITKTLHASLWYVLMVPIFFLELKIYGQWMSGGQRRLSKVANPSNHLSVVGNFVGALLGASMGLKEGPIFFFAVGLGHYTVLFVTLYQRLPTNETLPKELHPVFFLFVAAPSVASMAWAKIQGSFDHASRIAYFIAIFLYLSLAVRVNFFPGFRFSLGWWAYTFPMTGAAIATIRYSDAVTNMFTKSVAVIFCVVATLTVGALLVTTIIHAFVLRDLFPNDIGIAISDRRPSKPHRRWFHRRSGSSDTNMEQFLKYSNSDGKDIETSVTASVNNNHKLSDSVSKDRQCKHFREASEP